MKIMLLFEDSYPETKENKMVQMLSNLLAHTRERSTSKTMCRLIIQNIMTIGCGGDSNVVRQANQKPTKKHYQHIFAIMDSDKTHKLLNIKKGSCKTTITTYSKDKTHENIILILIEINTETILQHIVDAMEIDNPKLIVDAIERKQHIARDRLLKKMAHSSTEAQKDKLLESLPCLKRFIRKLDEVLP